VSGKRTGSITANNWDGWVDDIALGPIFMTDMMITNIGLRRGDSGSALTWIRVVGMSAVRCVTAVMVATNGASSLFSKVNNVLSALGVEPY